MRQYRIGAAVVIVAAFAFLLVRPSDEPPTASVVLVTGYHEPAGPPSPEPSPPGLRFQAYVRAPETAPIETADAVLPPEAEARGRPIVLAAPSDRFSAFPPDSWTEAAAMSALDRIAEPVVRAPRLHAPR